MENSNTANSSSDPIIYFNGLITIPNTTSSYSFLRLFNYQQSAKLCDTTIIAPEKVSKNATLNNPTKADLKEVHAHSCVLAVGSIFLSSVLLRPTMTECAKKKIILKTVSYSELLLCLKFMYGQKVTFVENKLDRILEISQKLRIDDLTIQCNLLKDFIVKKERNENLSRQFESIKSLPVNKQPIGESYSPSLSVMKSDAFHEVSGDESEEKLITDDKCELGKGTDLIYSEIRIPAKCNDAKIGVKRPNLLQTVTRSCHQNTNEPAYTAKQLSNVTLYHSYASTTTGTKLAKGKKSSGKQKVTLSAEERKRRCNLKARQPRVCDHCGETFKNAFMYKKHIKTIKGLYLYCQYCGKPFLLSDQLKLHERRHRKDKIFQCDYCDFRAVTKAEIQFHNAVHIINKKFMCEICGVSFKSVHTLSCHRSRLHDIAYKRRENKPKFYQCSECGLKKLHFHNLKVHLRSHVAGTHYSCKLCGKGYKAISRVRKHLADEHNITLPKLTTALETKNTIQGIIDKYVTTARNLDNVVTNYDPDTDIATLSLGNTEDGHMRFELSKPEQYPKDASSPTLQNQENYANVIDNTINLQQNANVIDNTINLQPNNFIDSLQETELETEQAVLTMHQC